MAITITKDDIIWSYAAQIFNFGAGIIILPVVLNKLPSAELGIWYAFMTINTFVLLLDLGFSPTIARNMSYVFSGAKKLLSSGIEKTINSDIDYSLLVDLMAASKKIYRIITIFSFLVLVSYSIFIYDIAKGIDPFSLWLSWSIFVISSVLSFYFGYYIPILQGRGHIKESRKAVVYSRLLFIIIAYIGVSNDGGLIAIAFANLVYSLAIRFFSYKYFNDSEIKSIIIKYEINKDKVNELIKTLWINSYKLGLVSIGSFFIVRFNFMLSAKYLGLEISAQYGLMQQIFDFLIACSTIITSTLVPSISQDRIFNNKKNIIKKFGASSVIAWLTYLAGVITLVLFGDRLLIAIHSKTLLLPLNIFLFYSLIMFLEFNHTIAATIIITNNHVPFLKSSLLSGFFIAVISFSLIKFTSLGLWGLLLSQFTIQILYNNWKWPFEVCKELGNNYLYIIRIGIKFIKDKAMDFVYG